MAADTDLVSLRVEVEERCGGARGESAKGGQCAASYADAFLRHTSERGSAAAPAGTAAAEAFAALEAISSTLLQHELDVTAAAFESARTARTSDLGKFKAQLAQLFGTLDNLQMKKIDAVHTDGIVAEDAAASVRLLRKQLGKRCSRCREKVETLHETLVQRLASK